jgi:hypothetical protein
MTIARTFTDNSFNSQSYIQQVHTQQTAHIWRKENTPTCFSYCIILRIFKEYIATRRCTQVSYTALSHMDCNIYNDSRQLRHLCTVLHTNYDKGFKKKDNY